MANLLTAGTLSISAAAKISGVRVTPQGTAPVTIAPPTAGAEGSGEEVFSFGTAVNQCDIFCGADYLLTAGSNVTIDIYANGLPNLFGAGTAEFRKLKAIYVGVLSGGDSAGVTVGGAASNAATLFFGANTYTWSVFPGGAPMVGSSPAGVTVDATHRNIKVLNNGAVSATVRVLLGGTSV